MYVPMSTDARVLILVLVEHTLGVRLPSAPQLTTKRLNPCFSGTYSRRWADAQRRERGRSVLILVLVEHTLGEHHTLFLIPFGIGLNPCFSGTYSRSFVCMTFINSITLS